MDPFELLMLGPLMRALENPHASVLCAGIVDLKAFYWQRTRLRDLKHGQALQVNCFAL